MAGIPKSLREAVEEDPDRFVKYLNIDKIVKSKNPHREFLKQFYKKYGHDAKGINLWKYLEESYMINNIIFKASNIQNKLKIRESLKKKEFNKFKNILSKLRKKKSKTKIIRDIIVNRGTEKQYRRSKAVEYNDKEIKFIKYRLKMKPSELTGAFNDFFKRKRSYDSIRTKQIRIRKNI